jgi:hypothetical protein
MSAGIFSPRSLFPACLLVLACGRTEFMPAPTDCHGVNLQTDNRNCGACGNPCTASAPSTATCTGGRCLVTLASGQGSPMGIVVDTDVVYWTGTTAVLKVSKMGGKPVTVVGGQLGGPYTLTMDDSNLYWVNYLSDQNDKSNGDHCKVMQAPKNGGPAIMLASDQPTAYWGIAVDATSVYWTVTPSFTYPTGSIMKVPIGGGTPIALATNQYDPTGLAVDATNVYWTTAYYDLMKVGINGGVPLRLANGVGPAPLVLRDGSIYSFVGDNVVKAPLNGGDVTTLASSPGNIYQEGIAVDETSVYWTENDKIINATTDGGNRTTLLSGQPNPWTMAVDATSLYWTDPKAGTVMKLSPK